MNFVFAHPLAAMIVTSFHYCKFWSPKDPPPSKSHTPSLTRNADTPKFSKFTHPLSMTMTNQHSSTAGDVGLVLHAQCTLQMLPVELLAEIFSELDLDSLIIVSCLSRRLRAITADVSLNPWRRPILRNLHRHVYDKSLFHLSVRSTVPRQNWIEILTFASSGFLLFDNTLPNLKSSEWEECFRRRFLPGWTKWKKDNSWREAFMKLVLFQSVVSLLLWKFLSRVLYRVWHRSRSSCTSDESWTK